MGMCAQFFEMAVRNGGDNLTEDHKEKVKLFIDTMRFYSRRDVDKTQAEDKHLFKVDEIMELGQKFGMNVTFYSNRNFENFSGSASSDSENDSEQFYLFFSNYLKYCMSFDEDLLNLFSKHMRHYFDFIHDISANNSGPYMDGIFVCVKK
jgi:hypothetical protein